MSAEDRDTRGVSPDTTGARFASADSTGGAAALVGDLQSSGNDSASTRDVVDALRDLVECCRDGEYGFRTSADRAERADLKPVLSQRAEEFRLAGDELNRLIIARAGSPEPGGSVMGAVHRGWVALQATLGDNDKAVLEGCERGQHNALARYRKALDKALPDDIRSVVEQQLQMVEACHAQMKMLRDQARAA
jgi:uncharacterized protein (TIGR02284 family)